MVGYIFGETVGDSFRTDPGLLQHTLLTLLLLQEMEAETHQSQHQGKRNHGHRGRFDNGPYILAPTLVAAFSIEPGRPLQQYGHSVPARMPKATFSPIRFNEFIHHIETRLHHRQYNQLRNSFPHFDAKRLPPPVPAGDKQLPLIIGIDQTDQIAQDDTVLMTKPRTGQNYRRQMGILDMDGHARGNKVSCTRRELKRGIQHGPQIHAGGPLGGVIRHWKLVAKSAVNDLQLYLSVHSFRLSGQPLKRPADLFPP